LPAFWSGEFPVTAVDPQAGTFTVSVDSGDAIIMEPQYQAQGLTVTVHMADDTPVPVQVGDTVRVQVRPV
jgi:hypothetical protein